jgi:hypothetical protein
LDVSFDVLRVGEEGGSVRLCYGFGSVLFFVLCGEQPLPYIKAELGVEWFGVSE